MTNNTGLMLEPNVYVSGEATTAGGLFVAANERTGFIPRPSGLLGGSESASFTVECVDLLTLGVDAPRFFDGVTLQVFTSVDRVFLNRDTDFACGNEIALTYFRENGEYRVRAEVR